MNIYRSSSILRLIAFFIVAIMLVCTFGFTVDGWSFKGKYDDTATNPKNDNQISNESDIINTDAIISSPNTEPEIYIPEYVNALTGLETTKTLSEKRPIAVVMSADNASYATSYADILAELPIEDGSTRFVAFITDTKDMGKIGSIAPSRNYISNLAFYLNAISISYGNDDSISYSGCDISQSRFDLTNSSGYHYSEYTHYQYSNSDLLNAGIKNLGITISSTKSLLPYLFNDFGNDNTKGVIKAENIKIAFSDSSLTEFNFNHETGKYTLSKNGEEKIDHLNGNNLLFNNCLILFADSVTYEGANGSQMVMNTIGSGSGFYFTEGTVTSIFWCADEENGLKIIDESGDPLIVNRGNTYIGFVKSSKIQSVTF